MTTNTLDTFLKQTPGNDDTERLQRLHAASMLAMCEAAYATINSTTAPVPLYRIAYDDTAQHISFEMLEGHALVPQPGSLDVSVLDLLLAAQFRDKLPLLFEGKTGTGKTFTTEHFLDAILENENYRVLRLSQNMTNVLQPYVEGYVENGVVKVRLKTDELDKIAALFIDEVNRGDSNSVLMLQDGTVTLSSGERGMVGVKIPEYKESENKEGEKVGAWVEQRKRPLLVISAQNPASTTDPKYTATRRTDAAQLNRNLQIDMPNAAHGMGGSLLVYENGGNRHSQFLETYRALLQKHLGIQDACSELPAEWIGIYAFTTDPVKTERPLMRSALEFCDVLTFLMHPSLQKAYDSELQVLNAWNGVLNNPHGRNYQASFTTAATLSDRAEPILKIGEVVNSFGEDFIPRDIIRVKKLADEIAFLRTMKQSLKSPNPLEHYLQIKKSITAVDVASASAVVLHDKIDVDGKDPSGVVSAVLKEYADIVTTFGTRMDYTNADNPLTPGARRCAFDLDDGSLSVYMLALRKSIKETCDLGTAVAGQYTTHLVRYLADKAQTLNGMMGGMEYRKPIVVRMMTDLATLAGFLNEHESEVEAMFTNPSLPSTVAQRKHVENGIKEMYERERHLAADIYRMRLPRVLGI